MNNEALKDILQWDIQSWGAAIPFWEKHGELSTAQTALEIGGREGGLSLWLAKKGIRTVCSDLTQTEATARPLHQRYQLNDLVSYEDIDATSIPYENHFDLILFKSVLGGVGRDNQIIMQQRALAQMHKALKPGGRLLFAENMSASFLHRYLRSRFVRWGNSWRYISLSEADQLFQPFASYQLKTTGFLGAFGRSEPQRNALAKIDQLLFNWVTPPTWRYIGYGVATKKIWRIFSHVTHVI